jgi:peptidoglycan/xylan/chitin deacetylase (PgdA/CDA1 family)
MYHYVRPAPERLPFFRYLHVEDFVRQLDWFARQYGFISREAFEIALQAGRVPQGVVLTFDDGLADHYEHVLPLLRERGLFGIFYVCTAPFDSGKLLDVHRIHLLLGRLGGQVALQRLAQLLDAGMLTDAHVKEFREATYSHQDNDRATTVFKRTLNYLISYEYRESVLDALFSQEFADQESEARKFYLSPDQIREMDGAGMVMGSHGASHYVFSKLPVERQRDEISRSFSALSRVLGRPVTTFSYPYGGRHTFSAETMSLLKEVGSRFSFDVNPRDVSCTDLKQSPQSLPRYDCNLFPHGRASSGTSRAQQAA